MSIDKVEVMNSRGDLLTLSLEDISNGYVVKEIEGLDPVKATLVSSAFANIDGEQEQASSREKRNIIFHLEYAPNYTEDETIRSLRTRLYRYFTAPMKVKMTFYMTDGLVVETTGTVESCEAPLFSSEPGMDISVICFDPDFVEVEPTEILSTFTTTDTEGHEITIEGTSPTGLDLLTFTANKALTGFTIYHTTPEGVLRTMQISIPLEVGDVVSLCTVKRRKSITLTRGGTTSSILRAVSTQAQWVQLEQGVNQLYINATSTDPTYVNITYHERHGGL